MDKYDIPFLIKDINDEMPLFSKDTVKVKRSYSQGMPKNLKEYGDKVNEKFLDNSLATIEDYSLKFPNNELTQWFKDYQNRYFNSVLLKDSFLKIDENGNFGTTRYYRGMSIQNVAFLASKISGGADLTVSTSTVTDYGTGNHDTMFGFVFNSSAVVGALYNTMYYNAGSVAGNIRIAVYGDSAGQPGALTKETGSNTAITGLNGVTVTNFTIATATSYQAFNVDNSGYHYLGNTGDGITRSQKTWAFGAFNDPFARGSTASGGFYGQVKYV